MICELTNTNYCKRHQTYHRGRLRQIALDPGGQGQAYRKLWDERSGYTEGSDKVLITAGLGDLIALGSLCEWSSVKSAVIATPAYAQVGELLGAMGLHLTYLGSSERVYRSKEEVEKAHGKQEADDWSIGNIFPQRRKCHDNFFMSQQLAEVKPIKNPYYLIVPESKDASAKRSLKQKEWANILDLLEVAEVKGLVLHERKLTVPKSKLLINKTGKTTILEALEYVKGATGYYGVDSALSVAFSKICIPGMEFIVKGSSRHLRDNLDNYYCPVKPQLVRQI